MTSKTELKELIISLRDEIRELKTEIEVLKTSIVNNNYNTAYPTQIKYTPYVPSITPCERNDPYPTITISDSSTNFFKSDQEVTNESDM